MSLIYACDQPDRKSRPWFSIFFCLTIFAFAAFLICASEVLSYQNKQTVSNWNAANHSSLPAVENFEFETTLPESETNFCQGTNRPPGTETLPWGIVAATSDLGLRQLWDYSNENTNQKTSKSLLSMAVGIKMKQEVNTVVEKFLASGFVVMLFHYDGHVDEWKDLAWNDRVIHVSALRQTKWWFAKRFLHPDIVAEYDYIFLWDEDLQVDNFNPTRYLSIIKDEGLEISQPGLDSEKSEVHHLITARRKNSILHRRIYKSTGSLRCDENSNKLPCTGWVEVMAPVFSRSAWRCAWYMIQNDLIHAWGLDYKLGYCASGDRSKTVGVVDSEYVVHKGVPTLGESNKYQASQAPHPKAMDVRSKVRRRSIAEMRIFSRRWSEAATKDKCWIDPYQILESRTGG